MKRSLLLIVGFSIVLVRCSVAPQPLTQSELDAVYTKAINEYALFQEPVIKPISLYEAMARAIKYNLDAKVELMTEALRAQELNLSSYDMLPRLVANSNYAGRSNFSGASSSQLISSTETGPQSLVTSTSSERETVDGDLSLSWDVLDFGLSYVRAKQQSDRVLIAQERKRSVMVRITESTRTAYWRAVSAERLIDKLTELENDVRDALELSQQSLGRGNSPPLSELNFQRELLRNIEDINRLKDELSFAKKQLAALMNLRPNERFELVMPDRDMSDLRLPIDTDSMVEAAIENRSEMREVSYLKRINAQEANAALLDLLPSLRAYGGINYNSNEFLFNGDWSTWGAQASWNLLEAFRYPARKKTVEAEQALLEARAKALTMAIVTQVHVSRIRYENARVALDGARDLHFIQENIYDQIDAGYLAQRVSERTHIRERLNSLVTDAKYDIALADIQNAFASVYASMGINPFGPDLVGDEAVDEMARKLEGFWKALGDDIQFSGGQ